MAAAARWVTLHARRCACGRPLRPVAPTPFRRPFSASVRRRSDDDDLPLRFDNATFDLSMLDREELEVYNSLSPEDRVEYERAAVAEDQMLKQINDAQVAAEEGLARELAPIEAQIAALEASDRNPVREERAPQGFFNMGEEEDFGPDDEEDGDMSSLGHGELEKHRELREYARRAAWEMPLLSKLTRPFELPSASQPLRFRYTTYMGEQHPAASKVVVEFSPSDIPSLTPLQRGKLIKLAGPRYNPSTEAVRMSTEAFPTQAQNRRYLLDQVAELLREARDPADTFEDVPFDFRHHKARPWHEFPPEWRMTPERQRQLEARRVARIGAEHTRVLEGRIVDGLERIQKMVVATPVMQTVTAPVPTRGGKSRGRPSSRF